MIKKICSKIYIPYYICSNFLHISEMFIYIFSILIYMRKTTKTKTVLCANGTLIKLDSHMRVIYISGNARYFRALKGFHKKPFIRGIIINRRGEVLKYQTRHAFDKKYECIPHTNNNFHSLKNLSDRITVGQHFFKDGVASYLKTLCGGYRMI